MTLYNYMAKVIFLELNTKKILYDEPKLTDIKIHYPDKPMVSKSSLSKTLKLLKKAMNKVDTVIVKDLDTDIFVIESACKKKSIDMNF